MKDQSYYNPKYDSEANVLNMTDDLCINCTGVVNIGSISGYKRQRNDYYIIYMLSGSMHIYIDNKISSIHSGQMVIIKPHTDYMYESLSAENIEYLWIHFSGRNAQKTLSEFNLKTDNVVTSGVHTSLVDCWKRLFYEFALNDEYFNDVSVCILKEILASFSRYINHTSSGRRFLKSIFYIHEHFNEALSVSALADMEGVSKTYYRSKFKEITGISPKEYIIQRRIEFACTILEDTDKNIEETAEAVGYSDVYYFSRLFKKKTGITPGKYRKS